MPLKMLSATPSLNRSRRIKRINALTAILTGGVMALGLAWLWPTTPAKALWGFVAGLVWANGFEYVYHRFLLHSTARFFARRHGVHHRVTGTPEEAQHLTFGESPLWIVPLFVVNGVAALAVDKLSGLGLVAGMPAAFAAYFVVLEELHWRIHLGERLPGLLSSARAYHLAHHHRPDGRYNVFFPLFDWLLGTAHSRAQRLG